MTEPLIVGNTAIIRASVWAFPAQGQPLDEFVGHLRELGNDVLQVDYNNQCVLVSYSEDRI